MGKFSVGGITLCFLAAIFLQGCVIAAVGAGAAGTVAYVRGDLVATEEAKLDDVYSAALKSVEDLELNLISDNKDALSGEIVVRDAEDKKIQIKMTAITDNTTKIAVRIGTFGDERKSRVIYEKIKENLEK